EHALADPPRRTRTNPTSCCTQKELLRLRPGGQRPRADFTPRSSTPCLEGHTKSTVAGGVGLRVVPVPYFNRRRLRWAVLSAVDNARPPHRSSSGLRLSARALQPPLATLPDKCGARPQARGPP